MNGEQLPRPVRAHIDDRLQNYLATNRIQRIWRLSHSSTLRVSQKHGGREKARPNLVVFPIDRSSFIPVKVRSVGGKRDEIDHTLRVPWPTQFSPKRAD
jgi:hypothetical protein